MASDGRVVVAVTVGDDTTIGRAAPRLPLWFRDGA